MLTTILRSNTISAPVLSQVLGLSMLAVPLLTVSGGQENGLLYTHWAFGWLRTNPLILPYLSVGLIAVAALFSRLRIREARQALGNSNLTMLAFIAIIMTQPQVALTRPDILIGVLISIGIFLILMSTYKRESVLSEIFHVGLFLGVATLFVGQAILLFFPVVMALLILRTGSWKEWTVLILGLLMVVILCAMVVIWAEDPILAFLRVVQSAWSGDMNIGKVSTGHLLLLPVFLASLGGLFGGLTVGTVAEHNITLACVGWLLGVILMVLLVGLDWQNGLILAAFPLSTFIARTLEKITRWWLADLLLLALLAAPFVNSLWQL